VYCNDVKKDRGEQQISLFDSLNETGDKTREEVKERDRKIQNAMNSIKDKFGKNAIFKSADLQEGATQLERNMQIGGHKSGNHE
jgi:DNA polymerase V